MRAGAGRSGWVQMVQVLGMADSGRRMASGDNEGGAGRRQAP
jgi:hypothetical protein